jgi:hypothetical protein
MFLIFFDIVIETWLKFANSLLTRTPFTIKIKRALNAGVAQLGRAADL